MRNFDKVNVLVYVFLAELSVQYCFGAARFDCYGDICNSGTNDQFCSSIFKLCRDCEDVRMSCGTEEQPQECFEYCFEYKIKEAVEKERAKNCSDVNKDLHGAVKFDRTGFQKGDTIPIDCGLGKEPRYTNTVECREFGLYQVQYPTCEAQRCVLSPVIANAEFNPNLDTNSGVIFNTTVTVFCKDGFTLVGFNTMTCLADNKWSVEAPFCLPYSYFWSETFIIGLLAVCATFFTIIIILTALLLWLRHRVKRSIQCNQKYFSRRKSSAESDISVYDHKLDETSKMASYGIGPPEMKITRESYSDTGSEGGKSVQTAKSATSSDEIKQKHDESNVDITNINNTYNVYGNVTHHIGPGKHTNPNNDDVRPDLKAEDNELGDQVPMKLPTQETKITIEASQETQERKSNKGAIPFANDNDTDIALDNVPLILKKRSLN